ncbi:hypothetical protein NPIL_594501 [Nephila pilipes]|uniref:Uncharacterized protein n=1 Tax=Nephila pilipes TaxID=299642 RepID=A0A8X6QRF2_NEPPI|nr:hypothetical protein NPIL_594501 [Nephila pilipes]
MPLSIIVLMASPTSNFVQPVNTKLEFSRAKVKQYSNVLLKIRHDILEEDFAWESGEDTAQSCIDWRLGKFVDFLSAHLIY